MTITVQPARNEYTANAGQTIFNYTFKIFSDTDLNVYITPAGEVADDDTQLTTAYTVTGIGDEDGGSITLTTGTNQEDLVTIVSNIPSSRTIDYQNNGDFRPVTVNADFDRVVSIAKKIEDTANRTLLLEQSQQDPKPLTLPNPEARKYLRWKDDLTGMDNATLSDAGIVDLDLFLINDLSQAYEFETIADMKASTILFPDNKALNIKDESGKFLKYIKVSTPSDEVLAGGGWAKKVDFGDAVSVINLSPLFIEQFLTGFGGRGQLDAEPNNSVTEQAIAGVFSIGAGEVTVTTPSDFVIGGHISILHDNGRYWAYFINDIVGASLTISPLLKFDVTNTTCERTWYNKAHPGKYYMRQLAQRAVYTENYKASLPSKRLMMSQFDTNPNEEIDTLTAIGGGVVSYFDAANVGGGGIGSNLRFNIGRAALVSCAASGDGAKSFEFMNNGACDVNLRLVMSTGNTDTTVQINVYDDTGVAIPMLSETLLPSNFRLSTPTVYDFPMRLSGSSSSFYVEIIALDLPTAGNLYIDELDVFELDSSAQQLLEDNSEKTLVAFGDSWIAGDLASTAEREPITQQLAIELPLMTIINEGVGGNTATDLLARFDADVTPHNPDFVLINTGTNDAYNPASGIFFPNSVDVFCQQITQLISKCQAIGAKPILYGVPALAESDGAFLAYELNDRARQYSQYFYKRVGRLVQSTSLGNVSFDSTVGAPTGAVVSFVDTGSGTVTKWADGTMIVRRNANVDMTQSSVAINFPEAFAVGTIPDVTMTLVSLQSGTTTAAMADAFMRCTGNTQWTINFPTAGTVTDENFNFMAIGRWY